MSTLENFPIVNQLNSPTLDGRPDENKEFNCVPSAITAGLRYLTGKVYEPDELKDAAYNEAYEGATAAISYVSYCAKQGVRLRPVNGSNAYLVGQIHAELAKGHPVVFTEPDVYVSASLGWSHVCVFFKDTATTLTAMDPFGGHLLEKSDADWTNALLFNQIWVMEKMENTTVGIPSGWKDDGKTLIAPNNIPVIMGFRQYVLASGNWHPDNWPLEREHGVGQLEASNPALGGGTLQSFRLCVLEWDQKRGMQEMWVGQELLSVKQKCLEVYIQNSKLQAQITALQGQVKAAQSNHINAGEISSIVADLQKIESQLSSLKG